LSSQFAEVQYKHDASREEVGEMFDSTRPESGVRG